MNEKELIRRADLALSDLASSGSLPVQASNRFVRKMIDAPTILNTVRVVPMRGPTMEISKIGFASRILRAASQGLVSTPERLEDGGRALLRAERAKPTTSKITLTTKEIIAEINLPYEVLEDALEGGKIDNTQFEDTLLELMAERAALDLEELLLLGDTSLNGADPYLDLNDGILIQAVSNIVNQGGDPMDPTLFANMIGALPTKYHRLLNQFRFYVSHVREIGYRMTIAQRQTTLGDATLTGTAPMSVLGVGMTPAALMPNGTAILTIPRNLIWGVQRDMKIEYDKDVRERVIIIVMTLRIDFKFEEEEMVVKGINIG
jgi:hypothetical protein